MPCFEYACESCQKIFELIHSSSSSTVIECPACGSEKVKKLISKPARTGAGDLRESTVHGCHGCHTGHKHGKD